MHEVMIDLETMGTKPNAAIVAIGAVAMDFDSRTLGPQFYTVVDLESSVAQGGVMAPATVLWWLGQSDEARAEFKFKKGCHINVALVQFSEYLRKESGDRPVHLWGNGAAFDNVVLRSAYERSGITPPWGYQGDRCYRTVAALNPKIPKTKPTLAHNALEDAHAQAEQLLNILRRGKP
jgi:exodeoxyribonuclease VIII